MAILLGATMRHTGTGLAIPDFPLMFATALLLTRRAWRVTFAGVVARGPRQADHASIAGWKVHEVLSDSIVSGARA